MGMYDVRLVFPEQFSKQVNALEILEWRDAPRHRNNNVLTAF